MYDDPKPSSDSQITFKVAVVRDSQCENITMDPNATVSELRNRLSGFFEKAVADESPLRFSGKSMKNDETLSTHKLNRNDTIYIDPWRIRLKKLGYSGPAILFSGLAPGDLHHRLTKTIDAIREGNIPIKTTTILEPKNYVRDWWLSPLGDDLRTAKALLFRAKEVYDDKKYTGWGRGDLYFLRNGGLQLLKEGTTAALPGNGEIYDNGRYYLGEGESGQVIRNVEDWSLVKQLERSHNRRWCIIDSFLVRTAWIRDIFTVHNFEVWDHRGEEKLGEVAENKVTEPFTASQSGYKIINPNLLAIYGYHEDDRNGFIHIWNISESCCIGKHSLYEAAEYGDDIDDQAKVRLVELDFFPMLNKTAVDFIKSSKHWEQFSDGTVLAIVEDNPGFAIATHKGQVVKEPPMLYRYAAGERVEEDFDWAVNYFWLNRFIVTHLAIKGKKQHPEMSVFKISSNIGTPLVNLRIPWKDCSGCDWHFDPMGRMIVSVNQQQRVCEVITFDQRST
ncbi:hypothetical protein FOPG_18386 [Fusarium oxysporum f. sp. conglutinans race 2 54008]|uniref:Ubiquitin-like domain-containing protein n=3 Tax=Fusarium oxysporum f. sp. conglutinans TaxID=100902 RepID=A0A8H6H0T2_FUSOX|nr:hypothetical protein FOXB_04596 [Fusarium oxysporum f. sp. conglutinans Fo5176]EXL65385.1 hypothetical protein FOPG_18386 [Fusarium oxysporum f. sp. conglutinans race 2 54008]KAF6528254.1 hypothetical protein HZS61_008556 [Fusarium oxysporum f. sp. conglutinans]KAG7000957.1 hypothetical protein FocnCong_v012613 [Fusarium oxysporum f. sp. conglutinans]KAI8416571.1 hypothetical protein FOFC_02883 [Fusarium oxysporum]